MQVLQPVATNGLVASKKVPEMVFGLLADGFRRRAQPDR